MPEETIDFSDIPEKTDWSRAVRFRDRFYRPVKQSTTVRILREAMVRDGTRR